MPNDTSHSPQRLSDALSDNMMAQLYRGELGRSDRWRMRLDTTSNWALTTAAATISFGFSNPHASHVIILVGFWMIISFLIIEARRYRYYDLWIHRVRLMEDGYWVPMLRREPADPDALKELAVQLERPQLQLSLVSAMATRINRIYGPLLVVLNLTWLVKLYSHPTPVRTMSNFVDRAHIGFIPGMVVLVFVMAITLLSVVILLTSLVTRPPVGELRSRRRSRKLSLWEVFARPYEVKSPRRAQRQRPAAGPQQAH